jgi:WD40 repeat protein/serine/threonine protein kinase
MPLLDRDRWQAVSPYLDRALEIHPDQLAAWLASLRAEQPAVAADLEVLLERHELVRQQGFLEDGGGVLPLASLIGGSARAVGPASASEAPTELAASSEHTLGTIGPYQLGRRLGEGGMGIVYLAEQREPIRRTVALKVIKPGLDSAQVLARFGAERQTLANLNHPGISKIYDAGTTADGRPYVVMEYVAGVSLTRFCDDRRLPVRERLELFQQVCAAIQHAHQKGVIHRDLKPSNLLVAVIDGRPVVKVIDFGIAKALQPTAGEAQFTQTGAMLGTPEYMSPEQAGAGEVDTRSDVYALGVVLYELLVGARPFDARDLPWPTPLALLETVRDNDPPKLTTRLRAMAATASDVAARRGTDVNRLARQLSGELEWITLRALEKQPDRRYTSAAGLAADLDRHLKGEAVLAGPPSTLYRLGKLARRHRAAAAALAVVAVAITVSAVVSTLALVRAVRAEDRTRRQLIGSFVAQGMQKVDAADSLTGLVYLVRALELETDPARVGSHRIRIGEVLQRSPRLVNLWRHESEITMLALSSSGLVATGSTDGLVLVKELASGADRATIRQGAPVTDGEFSPGGTSLAVASEDGRVRLWNPTDGADQQELVHTASVLDVALSPDGALLAAACADGSIRVWDIRSATVRFEGRHEGQARRAVFSNGGALLATAGDDGARVWQVTTGQPLGTVMRSDGFSTVVNDAAFSGDDRWLATAGMDRAARVWDVATGRQATNVMRHDGVVTGVRFIADSSVLVSASDDGTTRAWRVPDAAPVGAPRRSASVVGSMDVSRKLLIASATQGGFVDVWNVTGERATPSLPHGASVSLARFDSTARFVVSGASNGLARIWDLAPALADVPRIEVDHSDFHWRVVPASHGASVAVSSGGLAERSAVRVFDVRSGAPTLPTLRFRAYVWDVAFSPDGERLATASEGGEARVWDARTGDPLTPPLVEGVPLLFVAFSPVGDRLVVAGGNEELSSGGVVRIREGSTGEPLGPQLVPGSLTISAPISPDGHRLVTATTGAGIVKVWDAHTGRVVWEGRHRAESSVWSSDGKTVFTGGSDGRVLAWPATSGSTPRIVLKLSGVVSSLGVTLDGSRLLAGTIGGDVRLANLTSDSTPVAVMQHNGFVYESVFSPDGVLALTSAGDSTARLWDGLTGEPLTPSLAAGSLSRSARFVADGRTWAWTGSGLYIDDLSSEGRSAQELRVLAESHAAQALSESGTALALSAEEVEARVAASRAGAAQPPAPAPLNYHRAEARRAWGRRAFAEVISPLETVRALDSLNWPDLMRLLGAYAATSRWPDALGELRRYRARWPAAPELMYMEAVTMKGLGDAAASAEVCRAALDATRETQHPERTYWAARACLASPTVDAAEQAGLAKRIEHAHRAIPWNWGRIELTGAMLLRSGKPREAYNVLRPAVAPDSPVRPALLLVAAAAAGAGLHREATEWLRRADVRRSSGTSFLTPWHDAEAEALRREVVELLSGRR